jgi:hypothetical protein
MIVATLAAMLAGCGDSPLSAAKAEAAPAAVSGFPKGDYRSPLTFSNPYAHIPAQCYIETSRGAQNACLFCHTNGPYQAGLGNNFPQAGAEPRLGNLQLEYSFTPFSAFIASPQPQPLGKHPNAGEIAGSRNRAGCRSCGLGHGALHSPGQLAIYLCAASR